MEQFAHAYIIYSNTPGGRLARAREMIKRMIGASSTLTDTVSRRIDEDNYPDIMTISPVKGNISIDAVRSIRDFIALKPLEGTMKFVIITDCERMRAEAQNAMLKILEETPDERVIILLAAGLESILPTVLSRLQAVRLPDAEEESGDGSGGDGGAMLSKLMAVLLEGDIDALFELSGMIASADRLEAQDMLGRLYAAFHRLYMYLSGIAPEAPQDSERLARHMSAELARKISEIIMQGISDIKANGSMSIAAETMLITIREAYNAENSRN